MNRQLGIVTEVDVAAPGTNRSDPDYKRWGTLLRGSDMSKKDIHPPSRSKRVAATSPRRSRDVAPLGGGA